MADNFANTVLDLEQLRESIARHPDLLPGVQRFLPPFDAALTKVRGFNAHRTTRAARSSSSSASPPCASAASPSRLPSPSPPESHEAVK